MISDDADVNYMHIFHDCHLRLVFSVTNFLQTLLSLKTDNETDYKSENLSV